MNNKGITLITVVVIIIVIIIIATTSIIAGNKLTVNTRIYTDTQIIESVKEAINRRQSELSMQGTITPKGDSLPGKVSPYIGDGTIIAEDWYVLDKTDLVELGVKDVDSRFLVNYEYDEVLNMSDTDYLEKYFVCSFMHKIYDNVRDGIIAEYVGEALYNKTSSGDSDNRMYVDNTKSTPDYYGTNWYVVSTDDVIRYLEEDYTGTKLSDFIKNRYLVNYRDGKYIQITVYFEEI